MRIKTPNPMSGKEANEILARARMMKVFASKSLRRQDEYEIRFSHYSNAVYKKYEAARVFLLSLRIEGAA